MIAKKWIAVLMVMLLPLGVAGISFAVEEANSVGCTDVRMAGTSDQEVKGIISSIEGDKITVQDDSGESISVLIQDPKVLENLKVGDPVVVKDGKLIEQKG